LQTPNWEYLSLSPKKFKTFFSQAEVDLLTDGDELGGDLAEITIVPEQGPEPDPFDTGFAAKVLPNKGDPFDTSFVSGCPGKAEIHALEEEFLDKEDFDPRTAEGSSIPRKVVAPGAAGRARPKKGLVTDLKVKVPIPVAAEKPKEEEPVPGAEEEDEEDPFDTSIVNKVSVSLNVSFVTDPGGNWARVCTGQANFSQV
jgi:hypothetical protein